MQIPNGPNGQPTVSTTQLRTYGAGGFLLDEQEAEKGCPRLWKATYVERRVPERAPNYALDYGSFLHDVLFAMEEHDLTPEQAIEQRFPPDGDPAMLAEIRKDLTSYMERGASPVDRFATLAVELHLDALLYDDPEYGPVWFRGFLDWVGVDPEQPNLIHVVDYKSNRQPPSEEAVRGDQQLKSYAWLVLQNADRWTTGSVTVVVHLDAVKWREIEVTYTRQEIEDWHTWAVALVRAILRDDDGNPKVNPGCAWCPVQSDCPAFEALPEAARAMAGAIPPNTDPAARLAWRDAANSVRLLLEKSVAQIDNEFKTTARAQGWLRVGDAEWVLEPDWKTVIDMRVLHRALGSRFYDVVTTSKAAIERATADSEPYELAQVRQAIDRIPVGSKVTRRKAEDDG